MNREKKRPTLDELKSLPAILWQFEVSQIWVDALVAGESDIASEAELLFLDSNLTPEKVVELREKLQRAAGSTVIETAAPGAQPDADAV